MKTNHILAILAIVGGTTAAFTKYSVNNDLYPDWKYQKERIEGKSVRFISPQHLADLIYSKDENILLFDTREWKAYGEYHIPNAVQYEEGIISKADFKSGTIVLYGDEEINGLYGLAREIPGRVYVLKGGMQAWYSLVLFPDFMKYHVRNGDQLDHILRRSRFFGGKPQNTQLLNINMRKNQYREGC
jgi:hypothetical protein